jgi:triosephosphate isomerase
MLADAGCAYAIVGHSERRADHGEGDELVRAKAEAARAAGLVPIICIGETLDQRDAGRAVEVVEGQLDGSLPDGAASDTVVIAYEPVWAIGTGRTPTTADIAEVHASIRARLGDRGAGDARILYGGSVKPDNAKEILALDDVDGALVGGASLNADDFWAICSASP